MNKETEKDEFGEPLAEMSGDPVDITNGAKVEMTVEMTVPVKNKSAKKASKRPAKQKVYANAPKDYYTLRDISELTGRALSTVGCWIRNGQITDDFVRRYGAGERIIFVGPKKMVDAFLIRNLLTVDEAEQYIEEIRRRAEAQKKKEELISSFLSDNF